MSKHCPKKVSICFYAHPQSGGRISIIKNKGTWGFANQRAVEWWRVDTPHSREYMRRYGWEPTTERWEVPPVSTL